MDCWGGGGGGVTMTRRSSGKLKPRMKTWIVSIELPWGMKMKLTYHCYEQQVFLGWRSNSMSCQLACKLGSLKANLRYLMLASIWLGFIRCSSDAVIHHPSIKPFNNIVDVLRHGQFTARRHLIAAFFDGVIPCSRAKFFCG